MSSSRPFVGHATLLVLAIAVGGFLRFDGLGVPSYWLDEILGETLTTGALSQPWWHWLTGLDREHGPLYYAMQLASRIIGTDEAAGRLPSAIFGLATIALVWIALRPSKNVAASVGAILLATSPLHVYYSREARPYALLMFLTAALLVALLRDVRTEITALILVAMLYTSATAAPVLAAAAVATGAALFARRQGRDRAVGIIAAIVTLLVPLLYRDSISSSVQNGIPRFDQELATTILRGMTVSALSSDLAGRTMLALFTFAIIGAIAWVRRDRRAAILIVSMTVLPAVLALLSLRLTGHWFAIRYLAPSLIGFVMLAGTGIVAACEGLASLSLASWPRAAKAMPTVLSLAIVAIVASETWQSARRESFQKLDWRALAEILERRVKPGDVIATAEAYSYISLRHYLRVPRTVHFVLLDFVASGEKWTRKAPAAWLVTAGYSTPVSRWMCQYPLTLASPLQAFRMHYAPSTKDFLVRRSTPAEQRAVSTALGARGFTLRLGPEDEILLGEGWAGADVMRWAEGRRATLSFPRGPQRDRVISFHAYPLTHSTLPLQTMRVLLNGRRIADLTLASEWRDYEVQARAEFWIDGMNELAFEFGRATAPSAVDPANVDRRELSTAFDRISIDDVGTSSKGGNRRAGVTVRAGADSFLDEKTVWRNTSSRLPAARLRRDAVEALLARLGYDPMAMWPRLTSGSVRLDVNLDNVVETIAYGGDCEDHESFLRRAFGILLRRAPSEGERRDLIGRLAKDPSRVRIVRRIAESDEFRGQVLAR